MALKDWSNTEEENTDIGNQTDLVSRVYRYPRILQSQIASWWRSKSQAHVMEGSSRGGYITTAEVDNLSIAGSTVGGAPTADDRTDIIVRTLFDMSSGATLRIGLNSANLPIYRNHNTPIIVGDMLRNTYYRLILAPADTNASLPARYVIVSHGNNQTKANIDASNVNPSTWRARLNFLTPSALSNNLFLSSYSSNQSDTSTGTTTAQSSGIIADYIARITAEAVARTRAINDINQPGRIVGYEEYTANATVPANVFASTSLITFSGGGGGGGSSGGHSYGGAGGDTTIRFNTNAVEVTDGGKGGVDGVGPGGDVPRYGRHGRTHGGAEGGAASAASDNHNGDIAAGGQSGEERTIGVLTDRFPIQLTIGSGGQGTYNRRVRGGDGAAGYCKILWLS